MKLFDHGKECTLDEWLNSPERVLRFLNIPRSSKEINRLRRGSSVTERADVEELKECRRRGLATYDAKNKKWSATDVAVHGGGRPHQENEKE